VSAEAISSEAALADLTRALVRDRSHAVLVSVPGPETDILMGALADRLAAGLQVVRLAAQAETAEAFCARILDRLEEPPVFPAEAHLLRLAQNLAARGSALVLLLRDADSIPTATLQRLGGIAAQSHRGLRLGLVVEIDGTPERDAVANLLAALGSGAQKIGLDSHERSPGAEVAGRRPGAAVLRRRARPRTGWTFAVSVAAGMGLALLGVDQLGDAAVARAFAELAENTTRWTPPRAIPAGHASTRETGPAIAEVALAPEPPLSKLASRQQASEEEEALAELTSLQEGPEQAQEGPEAEASERLARAEPAEEMPVAALAPLASVSLNARPWARIEVDGRDVGITPLADLPLAPGRHRFRAHLPGGVVVERLERVGASGLHLSFP
jgi:hypothetical protein